MTNITEMPIDQAARVLARAQSTIMIKSLAKDLVESCQDYGLDAVTESVPNSIGPESISALVVDTLRDYVDKPDRCVSRLIALLEDHLQETDVFREQLGLAYRSLVRLGTVEVGNGLGDVRVRLGDPISYESLLIAGGSAAADRGENEV